MSAVTMHRSAHGLTSGTDDSWRWRAACRGRWAEFTSIRNDDNSPSTARAAHLCKQHCPVLADCAAAALAQRPIEMVQAGRWWPAGRYRPQELPDPGCGPWCQEHRGILPIWRKR